MDNRLLYFQGIALPVFISKGAGNKPEKLSYCHHKYISKPFKLNNMATHFIATDLVKVYKTTTKSKSNLRTVLAMPRKLYEIMLYT